MSLLFIGAWVAAPLATSPTGLFIQLFATAAVDSPYAFEEGVVFSALIGFYGGALVAGAYKITAILQPKTRRFGGSRLQ